MARTSQQHRTLILRINRALLLGLNLRAMMLVVLVVALSSSNAYPQTITFSYSLTCTAGAPGCPGSYLRVATEPGQDASDDGVGIATVKSDVPGYTQPVPINGGNLSWMSGLATWAYCSALKVSTLCQASYGPGGNAFIWGSVFGLPDGSTLLNNASFLSASSQYTPDDGSSSYLVGSIDISFVNPVVLANLGMGGLPNYGNGALHDYFSYNPRSRQNTFEVSVTFTSAVGLKLLHSFSGGKDGETPYTGLTVDKAGNLYGTTLYAESGPCYGRGCGGVFKLSYHGSGWVFTPLYSFQGGNDGSCPTARVTVGPDGSLYGTTRGQADYPCVPSGYGTVFSLRPPPTGCTTALCPWTETVLHTFTGGADGANPEAELIFDQAGNLYGTTVAGGQNGNGVVFQLTPAGSGWTEHVLYNFTGGADGGSPAAGLIFDPAGNLYGTTVYGGVGNLGTVFQLARAGSGWTENVLYSFAGGVDGQNPYASLIRDSAGNLYGTTSSAAYELSPSSGGWTFSVIYNIGSGVGYCSSLAMDASGNLYGTTESGGPYGTGTVFKLAPSSGGWTPTVLYEFDRGGGSNPLGGVIGDEKGNLYGTNLYGGAYGGGVVFELTP